MRELMVGLKILINISYLAYLYLYNLYSKLELCESNTLNSGENCPIWYSSTYLKLSERGTITEEPNPHLQKNETIQCMISGTKLIFWTFIPVWCRSREKEHHPKRECALWVIFCWMGVVAFLLISHSLDWVDNNDMTMSLTNSWVLGVCHTFFPCGFLSRWQLKKK